jgi:hypothetical protein
MRHADVPGAEVVRNPGVGSVHKLQIDAALSLHARKSDQGGSRPPLAFSARLGPGAKLPDVEQGSNAMGAIRYVTGKILSAFGRALVALVETRSTEMADYYRPYNRGAGWWL